MFEKLLEKNFTLKVKQGLAGVLVTASATWLFSTVITKIIDNKNMKTKVNKKVAKIKEDLEEDKKAAEAEAEKEKKKADTYLNEIYKLKVKLGELKKQELKVNDILNEYTLETYLKKSKIDTLDKMVLTREYAGIYNDLTIANDEYFYTNYIYYKKKVDWLNNVINHLKNGDDESLKVIVESIKEDQRIKKEFEEKKAAEAAEKAKRNHEIAMQHEEMKLRQAEMEHIERMKEMELDNELAKTAAYTGVAKSAIKSFSKKGEDE